MDLKDGGLTFLCDFDFPAYYNGAFAGASPWPFDPSECDLFLDLDLNNSSGDLGNGFVATSRCGSEQHAICDGDPDVYSDYGLLDSLTIRLINPMDGRQEGIWYKDTILMRADSGAYRYSFKAVPGSTNEIYEELLINLRYYNHSCFITEGLRYFEIIGYKNGISRTSYSKLNLRGPFYHAGPDMEVRICRNDPPLALSSLLDPCASDGGIWMPSTLQYGIFDPAQDLDSVFFYRVGDSLCGFDTSKLQIVVGDLPVRLLPSDTAICPGEQLMLSWPGSTLQFLWSDGSTKPEFTIDRPGSYWLQLKDGDSCGRRDTLHVKWAHLPRLTWEIHICANERYLYDHRYYQPGDTLSITLPSAVGCDTLLSILLLPIPVPAP
ncbi:MAG TPA: hypothetical protein VFX48_05390, partial [Saprospiraceae bacterium]|nr:hypothetical protein [Saprospiraceae bacterium]